MEERLYLPNSTGCFVCGSDNPHGLQIKFYAFGESVRVDLNFSERFNSYMNITHGGVLSAIIDEAMGWSAFIFSDSERFLFTRELTVTYKRNVPTGVPLLLTTEFVGMQRGGMAAAKGKITDTDGKLMTMAKGLFFPITEEKMAETKTYLRFDENLKYHPKALKYCKL